MGARTDLAVEWVNFAGKPPQTGVITRQTREHGMALTLVELRGEAARAAGKPAGRYLTAETGPLDAAAPDWAEKVEALAGQLRAFLPPGARSFLVAGLGNARITPDALGPQTVRYILTTRHLGRRLTEQLGLGELSPVSAIAPGVLGQTGMETAEVLRALCDRLRPDVVLAVDALAAGSLSRLGRTIQLSDTGIAPGSGVLNRRRELNRETLGVPVLCAGVPTVMDLSGTDGLSDAEGMLVTPREIDTLIEHAAKTIAYAFNRAVQPSLSLEEIAALTA